MKILAIDSSNTTMSLALCEDTSLIGAVTNTVNRNHSTSLMPALVELCANSNIKPTELDRIVVAQGPGSYTGLRIGVTTAKTLAWTLGIDLVGISSLATLAANGVDYQGFLVPLFDARRQNVYSGVYQWQDGQLVTILADRHISLASWLVELKQLDGEIRFIGRDQNQFKAEIIAAFSESSLTTSPQLNEVNALALAQLGLQASPLENTVDFIPVYLKLVEAEENWLAENQVQAGQVYVEKV